MMKRLISLLLAMMISLGICCAETTPVPDGAEVVAVFAQQDKQPVTKIDGSIEYLDTIWIYFTDYSFVQYAFIDDTPVLFSTGTYEFANGGDFLYEETEEDYGDIVIRRNAKYADGEGLKEYSSEHAYGLNTLGLTELFYGGDKEEKVAAIFAGCEKQTFNENLLDTYWIYYDDMTFEQYTCLKSDPVLFSTGTYEFAGEAGDFSSIVVRREQKFQAGLNLADYESEHTYNPFEMGYIMLVEKQAPSAEEQAAGMLVGGWQPVPAEARVLPEDARAAFDKATAGLTGAAYTPVALLSTQVVAGTNYCILCQITPVVPDAVPAWNLVYIYADPEGNAEILNTWEIYIDKHARP